MWICFPWSTDPGFLNHIRSLVVLRWLVKMRLLCSVGVLFVFSWGNCSWVSVVSSCMNTHSLRRRNRSVAAACRFTEVGSQADGLHPEVFSLVKLMHTENTSSKAVSSLWHLSLYVFECGVMDSLLPPEAGVQITPTVAKFQYLFYFFFLSIRHLEETRHSITSSVQLYGESP